MSRHRVLRALMGILGVGLAASAASAGVIRHDRPDDRYTRLAASEAYESVGQIAFTDNLGGSYLASGVLIDPQWVLTAAHVVYNAEVLNVTIGGTPYQGSSWTYHPQFDWQYYSGYDIGLVKLSNPVPDAIEPASRYRGQRELGQTGTSVGFGRTGVGSVGVTDADKTHDLRAGQNVIDGFVDTPGENPRLFYSDFDNPLSRADSFCGSPKPLNLEYMISFGDSGGGVFIRDRNKELLAGIHSFGYAPDGVLNCDYGDVSYHTRVSPFNSWIDDVLRSGGTVVPPTGQGSASADDAMLALSSQVVPEPSVWCLSAAGALCMAVASFLKRRVRLRR